MTNQEFQGYLKRIKALENDETPTDTLQLQLKLIILQFVEANPKVDRAWFENELFIAGESAKAQIRAS